MVKAELLYDALKSEQKTKNLDVLQQFLQPINIVGFGDTEAEHYADIRTCIEQAGTPIGPNDLIIAATVRSNQGTLVTHNIKEFQRVPGLKLCDWTKQTRDK